MPSLEASLRNLAKAKATWRPPRSWRSLRESQYVRSLVWQWVQSRAASEGRRVYPPCPRRKNRSHRFKAGRCACGYERSTVDADGYVINRRNRQSARRLARKLGVSHTWVNRLVREFKANPTKQERQESMWGPATWDQLREEQARRLENGFVRYRPRRIQRTYVQRQDSTGLVNVAELERQVKAFLKVQKNRMKDYGHL